MKVSRSMLVALALSASGSALAECPVALPYDYLMDCVVTEGAGGTYPVEKILEEAALQAEAKPSEKTPTATLTAAAPAE